MSNGEVVRSLFVTLRRGLARKPWFHRRILEALGLSRPHDCVEKPNNASIRGMLFKVPHLVIVETDKMFYFRKMRDHYHALTRAPLVVNHALQPPAASPSESRVTQHVESLHKEHLLPVGLEGFDQLHQTKRPTKYAQERKLQERVRLLTERGLYSERVKKLNQRDIEAKLQEHAAKRRVASEVKEEEPST